MSAKDIKPYKGKRKKLIEVLLEPDNHKDNVSQLCEKVGISRESYYIYTKDEIFCNHLKELSLLLYARHFPQTVNSVIKSAKNGNMQASKQIQDAMLGNGKGIHIGIVNEAPKADTSTFKDSTEAIEDIDKRIAELQEVRTSLQNRIKGHAIHPNTDNGSDE